MVKYQTVEDEQPIKKSPKKTVSSNSIKKPQKTQESLNYNIILMCINNYLKGYKKAYENAKNDPLSETKRKYEEALKEREKILNLK